MVTLGELLGEVGFDQLAGIGVAGGRVFDKGIEFGDFLFHRIIGRVVDFTAAYRVGEVEDRG